MTFSFNDLLGIPGKSKKSKIAERNILICEKNLALARASEDVLAIRKAQENLLKTRAML